MYGAHEERLGQHNLGYSVETRAQSKACVYFVFALHSFVINSTEKDLDISCAGSGVESHVAKNKLINAA